MKILTLIGPTASGKSAVALELATRLNAEIVNADSRQIYKHLDSGISKPSSEERKKIPHHLFDFLSPNQTYNAGAYANEARAILRDILARKKTPVIVGGTGLYLQALFDGLSTLPGRNETIRRELLHIAEVKGRKHLHEILVEVDPVSAKNIPFQNIQRVVRALEVWKITGKSLSDLHKETGTERFEHIPSYFGITWERAELKKRILERTRRILPDMIEETQNLIRLGFKPTDPACESLGYRQAFLYLDGKLSREDLLEAILTDTYHYAKRQSTWFRRNPNVFWIQTKSPFDPKKIARTVFDIISRRSKTNGKSLPHRRSS